ncbi:MAG: hypothetical protein IPP49_00165 [Saprospiraceae bacterium]|nr:hypothetical protein [Saprospiraceae bacterium]
MSDCVRQGLPSDISFFIAGNSLTDISKPRWVKLFADDQLILDKEVFLSANGFYSESVKYTPTKDVKYFLEFHCVKDKCFTQTSSVQKTIPDYIIQTKDISCADRQDGEVKLMPETVKNLDLVWESGEKKNFVTNMHSGVYNVTVEHANGCKKVKEISIKEPKILSLEPKFLSFKVDNKIIHCMKVEVKGGQASYLYDWDENGLGIWEDKSHIICSDDAKHTVKVMDQNGCIITEEIKFEKSAPKNWTVNDVTIQADKNGRWKVFLQSDQGFRYCFR